MGPTRGASHGPAGLERERGAHAERLRDREHRRPECEAARGYSVARRARSSSSDMPSFTSKITPTQVCRLKPTPAGVKLAVACALLLDGTISEGVWRAPPRAPACPSATSRASSDRKRPTEPIQPTRAPGAQRAPRAPEDSTRWALPGWARVSRTAAARQTEPVNVGASEGCYTKRTPAAPKNGPRCDS